MTTPSPAAAHGRLAVAVLAGLVVLLGVLGYVGARLGESSQQQAAVEAATQEKAQRYRDSQYELSESQRAEVPTPRVEGEPPAEPLAAILHHLKACRPALEVLASGVRILALDLSPQGVDVVQESSAATNRYLRIACEWNGSAYGLSDNGRMVVPRLVGEPREFPAELVPHTVLDPAWISSRAEPMFRIARRDDLVRLEVSYVHGQGVLLRARFADDELIVDADVTPRAPGTPFPQVERMRNVDEADADAAAERGYRDLGQTLWTVGLAETVDRLRTRYFEPDDRFVALEILRRRIHADLHRAGGEARHRVEIDEYGERDAPRPVEASAVHCVTPFTLAQARTVLDEAIAARGESLPAFEAVTFEFAVLDCADGTKPAWRFGAEEAAKELP